MFVDLDWPVINASRRLSASAELLVVSNNQGRNAATTAEKLKFLNWFSPWHACCLFGYTRPREPTNERRSHQNAGFSIWVQKSRTPTAGRGDPSRTHPQPGLWSGHGAQAAKHPSVGTQTLVPLNFSVVVAPLCFGVLNNIPGRFPVLYPILVFVH